MVKCDECISKGNKEKYTDPFESALRTKKAVPTIRLYVLPQSKKCNIQSCNNRVRLSGWFETTS